jgi:hypothetical protein
MCTSPGEQHELGVVGFFKGYRGMPVVSGALMDPISKQFVADIRDYAHRLDVRWCRSAPESAKTTSPNAPGPLPR